MKDLRHTRRLPVTVERSCGLLVIAFRERTGTDHVAHIVDISREGVGVESEGTIEPGYVWFKGRVGGHKGGVLLWTKQMGNKCRAGIRFIPLPPGEEKRQGLRALHEPRRSPEEIISMLVESLKGKNSEN